MNESAIPVCRRACRLLFRRFILERFPSLWRRCPRERRARSGPFQSWLHASTRRAFYVTGGPCARSLRDHARRKGNGNGVRQCLSFSFRFALRLLPASPREKKIVNERNVYISQHGQGIADHRDRFIVGQMPAATVLQGLGVARARKKGRRGRSRQRRGSSAEHRAKER